MILVGFEPTKLLLERQGTVTGLSTGPYLVYGNRARFILPSTTRSPFGYPVAVVLCVGFEPTISLAENQESLPLDQQSIAYSTRESNPVTGLRRP